MAPLVARFSATAALCARRASVSAAGLQGPHKTPFYLSGNVSGRPFSVHAEGERLVLRREGEVRQEIELVQPPADAKEVELPPPVCPHAAPDSAQGEPADAPPPPPGQSAIDKLQGDVHKGDARQGDQRHGDEDGSEEDLQGGAS